MHKSEIHVRIEYCLFFSGAPTINVASPTHPHLVPIRHALLLYLALWHLPPCPLAQLVMSSESPRVGM